jgi:hypothetical protein
MRKTFTLLWLLLASGAVAAGEPGSSRAGIAPPKRIPDPIALPAPPPGTRVAIANIPKEVRRAVVADAARRFEVAQSAVVLARAEQVTWSDSSLGCPSPGRQYAQVQVTGFRITVTTASGRMLYHTDSRGSVVACATQLRT